MIPRTPRGFRDVLPTEAAWRKQTSDRVCERFESWGYMPVETPAVELANVIDQAKRGEAASGERSGNADTPFRFFDGDNELVVLRPDVTVPVARLAATRLSEKQGPFRLFYNETVFTERESTYGQERQFTQLGIEFIGRKGFVADAEVLCVCKEALDSAGVSDYTLAIGTVGVLNALVRDACADEGWRQAILQAFHSSDMVAIDMLAGANGVKSAYGDALSKVARIRGGRDAFQACREVCEPLGCIDGLEELEKTFDLVQANSTSGNLIVDFSIVSSFDYYTGLVFKAYAPQVAASIASGGRYDATLAAFGHDAPAAGFAIGLERVLAAIEAQGATPPDVFAEETVEGDDPYEMFSKAAKLREEGKRVALGGGMHAGR